MATQGRTTASRAKSHGFTPLGIIATFVALSETVAGLAAVQTQGIVQMIFAIFAVCFPVLIAGIFFAILWKRSYVLYPPQEFGAEVDVRHYVEAMRHQAVGNQELHSIVRTTIAETLSSQTAQQVLSEAAKTRTPSPEDALKKASEVLVEEAVDRLQHSVLTVDITGFEGGDVVPDLVFPYHPKQDAFTLLSAVYFQITEHVEPFTYGKQWALQDTESGNLILPPNVNWADKYALQDSGATVEQLGLAAGMRLRAILLQASATKRARTRKRVD